MKRGLRRLVPRPVRAVLRAGIERAGDPYRYSYYLNRLFLCRYAFRPNNSTIDLDRLRNALPNSGAVPVGLQFSSAREIVALYQKAANRRLGIEGFEGFALDDAVFDPVGQRSELWSFAKLGGALAAFGYANYRNPSVLELGCGPAHLFFFLRRFGIRNYVGIDGNPWFTRFNPHLSRYESHFLTLNLQEEIRLCEGYRPLAFDIVCAFEVLEHIREDRIDNFIRTIRNHMRAGSVAFCTASLQTGIDVHVLVRDRGWWLQRFAAWGLTPRSDEADLTRRIAEGHPFNWNPDVSNVFALEIQQSAAGDVDGVRADPMDAPGDAAAGCRGREVRGV